MVGEGERRFGRNFQEEMEMVVHAAVGEDAAASELSVEADELPEVVLRVGIQEEFAANHAGDTVVNRRLRVI